MRKIKPCPCSINELCLCNECTRGPIAIHCGDRIAQKEREQAMRDLGLVKVRSNSLGSTYWKRIISNEKTIC